MTIFIFQSLWEPCLLKLLIVNPPLDVVVVAEVVSLHALLHVVEDDDGGDEVHDLPSG